MATVSEGGAWGAIWAGAKATHARALEYCMAMVPLRACVSLTATKAEPSWLVRGQGMCSAKVLRALACCLLSVSMDVHVRDGSRQLFLTRRSYAFALTCCVLTRELGCDGLPRFWARRRLGGDGREEHVGPLLGRYFCRGACPARLCFVITSRRRRVAYRFHFHDSRSLWLRRLSACELRTLAVRRLRSRLAWRSRTGRRYMQSSCARDRM